METKICSHCKKELSVAEFHKNSKSRDGYSYMCKSCTKEMSKHWRIKRKDKVKKQKADYAEMKYTIAVSKENALASATPRDLMNELYKRGYRGVLEYTEVHKIDISNF